jgi:hypothetical protein
MKIEKEYTKLIHYSSASESYPESKVEFTFENGLTIDQMLEQFEFFLKSIGYVFDGYFELVDDDYYKNNNLEKKDYKREF